MKLAKQEDFKQACSTLVQMLSHKEMSVSFVGEQAYCEYKNGKINRVVLPNIDINNSDTLKKMVRGYLDHEVGHLLFTDQEVVIETINKLPTRKRRSARLFFNIFEDGRIESCMKSRYEGTHENIATLISETFGDESRYEMASLISKINKEAIANQKFLNGLALLTRAVYGDKVAEKIVESHLEYFQEPLEFFDKHPEIAEGLRTAKDSKAIIDLAIKVCNMGVNSDEEDDDDDEANAPSGNSEDGEPSSSGKNSSKQNDEEDSDNRQDGGSEQNEENGENEPEKKEGNASEGEEPGGGGCDYEVSSEPKFMNERFEDEELTEDPLREAIKKKYRAEKDVEDVDGTVYRPFTTDFDEIEPVSPTSSAFVKKLDLYSSYVDSFITEANAYCSVFQKQFERYLNAKSASLWEYGQTKGRLYGGGLAKLAAGNERIFRKRIVNDTKDVAITLLIDCSGSMTGRPLRTACASAYIFSKALSKVGINHEVVGFTTKYLPGDFRKVAHDAMGKVSEGNLRYSRFEAIHMPIFKEFGKRFDTNTAKILGAVGVSSGGGVLECANNVDGESLRLAAQRLLKQPESRKIIFVFSDGEPAFHTAVWGMPEKDLHNAVSEVSKAGVELLGIGIESNSVSRYYPNWVVTNDIKELPTVLIRELKSFLVNKCTSTNSKH